MKTTARAMSFLGIMAFGVVTLIVHQGDFTEGDLAL